VTKLKTRIANTSELGQGTPPGNPAPGVKSNKIKLVVDRLAEPLRGIGEALSALADSFESFVELERQRFEKEFPHKAAPRPVKVGTAEYDKPEQKPEQRGDVFPEIVIGPREAALLARQQKPTRRGIAPTRI
jgi:hypothetical protein